MPDDNNNNNNGGGDSNGNGSDDTQIAEKYEYVDADVWIKTDADGSQDVAYTEDVNQAVDSDSSSDSSNGNGSSSS